MSKSSTNREHWTAKTVQDIIESRGYLTKEDGFQAVADAHNDEVVAACKAQANETKQCIEMVGGLGNQQEVPMARIMENEAKAAAGMARLRERKR
jgi:hypothetical protein